MDQTRKRSLTDKTRQALSAPRTRYDTEGDLRLTKLRLGCADEHVTGHGKLASSSELHERVISAAHRQQLFGVLDPQHSQLPLR